MTATTRKNPSVLAEAARRVTWVSEPQAGQPLYLAIRAGLMLKGTSFNAWCADGGIDYRWAKRAVVGEADGPAARDLRMRLIKAAGLAT